MTKPSSSFSVLSALGTVAAGAGSLAALLDTSQCLRSRILGGSQVLAQKIAESLGPAVVRLDAAVLRIDWSAFPPICEASPSSAEVRDTAIHLPCGSEFVTVTTSCGSTRVRRVIIAVPPNLVPNITFCPSLPTWRSSLHAAMTQGHVIKILVVYPLPFWRELGLSGEGFAPHSCSIFKEIYDNTPSSGRPGVICSFLVGKAAVAAAAMPGGVEGRCFHDLVVHGISRFLGPDALIADAVVARDWSAEQWTGGGYCATFGFGGVTEHACGRDRCVGPLYFAATELAGVGHMHMEGALRSGSAAAAALLAGIRASSKL
jgi:putrescine oxidase